MLLFWLLYGRYTRYITANSDRHSIVDIASNIRRHWVANFMKLSSDQRIPDSQLVNLLHRGISFFISITIFVIAGLMAMLSSGDTISLVFDQLGFGANNARVTWDIKILLIITIFVVAFFRLTWALRQSQYYAIVIPAAPCANNDFLVNKIVDLMSDSSKNFNNALRAYYFGLSMMSWLIHPALFIVSTILVVWVIYRREFNSKTLKMLKAISDGCDEHIKSQQIALNKDNKG